MNKLPKVVVLLGSTASGKTGLGIALAKQFNGEIISADSRQIYKGINIGTGKPEGEWQEIASSPHRASRNDMAYVVEGVPHYLMDLVSPNIIARGKLPIIVGGTGLYIWSLVDNLNIPKVPPSSALRKSLESKPLEELVKLLGQVDPEAWKKVDIKNPRRVLRALEVAILSGESFTKQQTKSPPLFDALQIGLHWPREALHERISRRVEIMFESGLEDEVKKLVKKYPWTLPSMSGIGYREWNDYLSGTISLDRVKENIKKNTRNYAKRQMTWFKRDKRIKWIDVAEEEKAKELIKKFLK